MGFMDIALDILPGVTWNELFFNQTGAYISNSWIKS